MRQLLHLIRSHIRYKIILPYLALTLLITMVGATIVLVLVAASAQDVLTNNLANSARATSDALVRREQGHIDFLRQVALSDASVANGTPGVADALASGQTDVVSKTLTVFYVGGISNVNLDFDRMIAFERNGKSLIDWQRTTDDPTGQPFRNASTDLSPIPDVKRITSNTLIDGADKFSGLIQFGQDLQPYFYTIVPVKQGTNTVGGLMIAIKVDRLLLTLQRSTQAPITTFYNPQGEAIGTTFVPRAELSSLNMQPNIIAALTQNTAQSIINSENKPGQTIFPSTILKRAYELAYSPLVIQGKRVGYFSVGLPTDFQVSSVTANRNVIAAIGLILALGSILLGYRIVGGITGPLAALVNTAEAVNGGDLERRSEIQSTDEVGKLANSFNQMTVHLMDLYRAVQSESIHREAILESLTDGVVVCNPSGTVTIINRAMHMLLDLDVGDSGPTSFADIPLRTLADDGSLSLGTVNSTDVFALGRHTVRLSSAPVITESGEQLGDVYIVRDVTDEVRELRTRLVDALEHAASVELLSDIGNYTTPVLRDTVFYLISSALATALVDLEAIAGSVRGYLAATSPVTQHTALAQITEQLDATASRLKDLPEPFGPLFQRTIVRWRSLITIASSTLIALTTEGPVRNPYVFGNPVEGSLFLGREDVMRRLEELWGQSDQCSSVILYGHRRMGKSSVLRNLGDRFGHWTIVVDFNMQRVGRVHSTGELLFNLALKIYDAWHERGHEDLLEPEEAPFLDNNPYLAFDRFLGRLGHIVNHYRFIITLDEFELIEQQISEKHLDPYLLEHWRSTFQTYPWIVMAFAGLHSLEEMRQDYWSPLFGSVTAIEVSFLLHEPAHRLITQPAPDFAIDYDIDAVEKIITLTNGQPYLIQLIGHNLVTRLNRQTYEEGIKRDRRFTIEDVEAIINSPEFYRDGNAYFKGVWLQAVSSQPSGQDAILQSLHHGPLSLIEISLRTGLDQDSARAALYTLQHHDVVIQHDGRHSYSVELMRLWMQHYQQEALTNIDAESSYIYDERNN